MESLKTFFGDSPYFSHVKFHSRIFGTAWPNIEEKLKITWKLTERNWTCTDTDGHS